MTPEQTRAALKARFKWVSDGRLDSYHIMAADGPVEGDCDDYAITLLFDLAGRSHLRMWWWLITFRGVLWLVKSPNDENHVTLWFRGAGYTDNWKGEWTEEETLHRKLYPLPWPLVALKLFIGLFDRT